MDATDGVVDVGTKMRGGRISTASSSASACSNSTLRSLSVLAVDEWRLCCMDWLTDAAVDATSTSSSRLFSSSCCALSDAAAAPLCCCCGGCVRLIACRICCCCCVQMRCISRTAALRVSIIPSCTRHRRCKLSTRDSSAAFSLSSARYKLLLGGWTLLLTAALSPAFSALNWCCSWSTYACSDWFCCEAC